MAALTDLDRIAVWTAMMHDASASHDPLPLIKADLKAAVDAVDTWVDANLTAFNAAIPLPARTALTAKQKAQLLQYVVMRRWQVTP